MALEISSQQFSLITEEFNTCGFDISIMNNSPFRCRFTFRFNSFTFNIVAKHRNNLEDPQHSYWYVGIAEMTNLPSGKVERLEEYLEGITQTIKVMQILNSVLNEDRIGPTVSVE